MQNTRQILPQWHIQRVFFRHLPVFFVHNACFQDILAENVTFK